jgi:hypothetical protein
MGGKSYNQEQKRWPFNKRRIKRQTCYISSWGTSEFMDENVSIQPRLAQHLSDSTRRMHLKPCSWSAMIAPSADGATPQVDLPFDQACLVWAKGHRSTHQSSFTARPVPVSRQNPPVCHLRPARPIACYDRRRWSTRSARAITVRPTEAMVSKPGVITRRRLVASERRAAAYMKTMLTGR